MIFWLGAHVVLVSGLDEPIRYYSRDSVPSPALVRPPALRRGDTVALVAPASNLFEEAKLQYACQWLTKVGLKFKVGKHIFDSYSDMAGQDAERADDLHAMWADPAVSAIIPVCGGNGTARLLPLLDMALIASRPLLLVGYSDITALHLAIHQQSGLVTFYGPMACSFYRSNYTYRYWLKAVMSRRPIGLVTDPVPAEPWDPKYPPCRVVIAPGRARGRLTGGCMTVVHQLIGTPYQIDTAGKIVFLEDLLEEPHTIDRFLTHMLLTGKLADAAGIIVGECVDCKPGDSLHKVRTLNSSLERVLKERLGGLGIPVVYGMRLGHGVDQITLPLGITSSLQAEAGNVVFKIEESAAR
jgi:muramoyltetrapeptide carboxypeptidase